MAPPPDDDATIRVRRAAVRGHGVGVPAGAGWVAAAAAFLIVLGLGVWSFAGRSDALPPAVSEAAPPAAVAAVPEPAVEVAAPPAPGVPVAIADEAAILAARSGTLMAFRLTPSPGVLVLVFPTLAAQGEMLNRVGALVEKAGLPRNEVLSEPELASGLARLGERPETFYFGHDYRVADIARFFALARSEGLSLRPAEEALRDLLARPDLDAPPLAALISLTQPQPDRSVDESARATILRHELSHGLYFTDPVYAAYAQRFWQQVLSEEERAKFRAFLGRQGYDTSDDDLMLNETQAYLVHTADTRFFQPGAVHLAEGRVAKLRAEFVRGMPPSWLRDRTEEGVVPERGRARRPRRALAGGRRGGARWRMALRLSALRVNVVISE